MRRIRIAILIAVTCVAGALLAQHKTVQKKTERLRDVIKRHEGEKCAYGASEGLLWIDISGKFASTHTVTRVAEDFIVLSTEAKEKSKILLSLGAVGFLYTR